MTDPTFQDRAKGAFRDLTSPEGLATGALGAFLFGGPVGIALGLAQGILGRRMRESELEAQAQEQEMLAQFDKTFLAGQEEAQKLAATDIDRAQLTQVGRDYQMLRKQAMSPDPATRRDAVQKLASFTPQIGAWLEDLEGRNETLLDRNVALLDSQADAVQADYQTALARAQDTQRVASEMHQLLSDPGFDANSMINRARLASLINETPRSLFTDTPDMADALKETGAALGGIPGAIASWISGKQKAEDFQFSKEDWRKLAYAMQLASKRQTDQQLADATENGRMLDETAQRIGHVPALSYIDRIITGKVQPGATLDGSMLGEAMAEKQEKERAAQRAKADAATAKQGNVRAMVEKTKEVAENALKSTVRETLDFVGIRIRDQAEGKGKKKRPTNGGSTGSW